MTIPNRNPYTFDDQQSLHDFLRGKNLRMRPIDGTLKLNPLPLRPPPGPEMATIRRDTYPISVPPKNPNYVWVTNRDNLSGKWFPINSPIKQEDVGPTTFRTIESDQTFQPKHHGINTSKESTMTDEELGNQLRSWNLPSDGSRKQLFERNIRARLHPTFQQNMASGNQPNEAELADILGKQNLSLEEAARIREIRQRPQMPSQNNSIQALPSQNSNRFEQQQGPLTGGTMRLRDEAPMSTSIINREPSQVETLTQEPNLSSTIIPQANTGVAAAEEAGAMGGMEMMASRALPILNMVFLGKMLGDSLTAGSKQKKMQQQELMYRT